MRARSDFCHNCRIRLTGPFCAACGQKDVPLAVTLHDFSHELTHEMLHVGGRLFQSVRRLLLSPGFLTREYIQGRRAPWISPIRLYLIFSVAAAVNQALVAWVPRVMFVLLPLFAGFVALAYRRIDPNYLHHLVFAVHVHAAWFGAGMVVKAIELANRPVGAFLLQLLRLTGVIYAVLAFRCVYGRARLPFLRIALVLGVYLSAFVLAFTAIVLPVVFHQFLTKST